MQFQGLVQELESVREALRDFESQNENPTWWVWPGKTREQVLDLMRLHNAKGKDRRDFVPDEVWIVSTFAVARRFVQKPQFGTPR